MIRTLRLVHAAARKGGSIIAVRVTTRRHGEFGQPVELPHTIADHPALFPDGDKVLQNLWTNAEGAAQLHLSRTQAAGAFIRLNELAWYACIAGLSSGLGPQSTYLYAGEIDPESGTIDPMDPKILASIADATVDSARNDGGGGPQRPTVVANLSQGTDPARNRSIRLRSGRRISVCHAGNLATIDRVLRRTRSPVDRLAGAGLVALLLWLVVPSLIYPPRTSKPVIQPTALTDPIPESVTGGKGDGPIDEAQLLALRAAFAKLVVIDARGDGPRAVRIEEGKPRPPHRPQQRVARKKSKDVVLLSSIWDALPKANIKIDPSPEVTPAPAALEVDTMRHSTARWKN